VKQVPKQARPTSLELAGQSEATDSTQMENETESNEEKEDVATNAVLGMTFFFFFFNSGDPG